jgi:uncharacterized membrane-anchored protein YitT (DUF2179 family)
LLNHVSGLPVGVIFFLLNVPILVLGYYYLGGWRFLVYTLLAVTLFSITTDLLLARLPHIIEPYPLTSDMFLSAVYAGLLGGVGSGLVFRGGGTPGGTNTLGRLIQRKTGLPLSQSYLYVDGTIVLLAVVVFGWEIALHGLMVVFFAGLASEFTMEGPSMVRTLTIVTDHPDEMTHALVSTLHQNVSRWTITDSDSGQQHTMLHCTIYRSQVNDAKHVLAKTDPTAFVTIGDGHQALGGKFQPLEDDG